jgi:hypothetical protein|tara:strand:+ start:5632 stop:5898 length:267 start_codon:yes stop_codon:yes gene_type:complete
MERQKRNSHSELSLEVHRNNNGLKLNKAPVKRMSEEPFLLLRPRRIIEDWHDSAIKTQLDAISINVSLMRENQIGPVDRSFEASDSYH